MLLNIRLCLHSFDVAVRQSKRRYEINVIFSINIAGEGDHTYDKRRMWNTAGVGFHVRRGLHHFGRSRRHFVVRGDQNGKGVVDGDRGIWR